MAIIIIADNLESDPQPMQPAVPAPAQAPATIQPQQIPPAKPSLETGRQEVYDSLNKIIADYPFMLDKDQAVEDVYHFALSNGTIGSWLEGEFMKHLPDRELAQQEAKIAIWKMLEHGNIQNAFGWLRDYMNTTGSGKRQLGREKSGPESNRFKEHEAILKPLMLAVVERNSSVINPDLLEKVDSGELEPQQAAFEQFKRKQYNDKFNPATGKTRIETAKEAFMSALEQKFAPQLQEYKTKIEDLMSRAQIDPKLKKNFDKELKKASSHAIFEVKSLSPLTVGIKPIKDFMAFNSYNDALGKDTVFNDPKSEYYLTGNMIESRVTPQMLDEIWSRVNSGPNLSADAQEGEIGEGFGYNPSTEEGKQVLRMRDKGQLTTTERRTIMEEAPFELLNEFDDPEQKEKIEQRLDTILPVVKTPDQNGNVHTKKNPNFQRAVKTIVENLYGRASAAKPVLDERGRPRFSFEDQQRTKEVLYMVGQFLANSLDGLDEGTKMKDLERTVDPLLQQPLALKHYEGRPLKAAQQRALAFREVMIDMMNYLGNDKNYSMLQQQLGSAQRVAAFRRVVRTASFLIVNQILMGA